MKTIVLATLFLSVTLFTNAQFTAPGQKVLSSAISFNSGTNNSGNSSNPEIKYNNFSFNAAIGKFYTKNVLTTFAITYATGKTEQTYPTYNIKNTTNSIAASFRKTWYKEIAKKFYFGIGGDITGLYNTANVSPSSIYNKSKSQGYAVSIGIEPVFNYQLTNRLLANLSTANRFLSIDYSHSTIKTEQVNGTTSTGTSNGFNLNTGFWSSPLSNLTFGFSYLLKNK